MQIVLSAHVVGLSFFELGMRGGKLSLRGDDSRLSVFNIGSGELELAGRVDGGDWPSDISRLGGVFGVRKIGLRLFNCNFVILWVDLDEHRAFLHPLVVFHVHTNNVAGDTRAEWIEMNIRLSVVG